jgi:hypothetical protein
MFCDPDTSEVVDKRDLVGRAANACDSDNALVAWEILGDDFDSFGVHIGF